MQYFSYKIKVDQIVTREIEVLSSGRDEEQARERAIEAIHVYPQPLEIEGIKKIRTVKETYWTPRDIDIVDIAREQEPA